MKQTFLGKGKQTNTVIFQKIQTHNLNNTFTTFLYLGQFMNYGMGKWIPESRGYTMQKEQMII